MANENKNSNSQPNNDKLVCDNSYEIEHLGEFTTLKDGTDISGLKYNYRKVAHHFDKKTVLKFYDTLNNLDKLKELNDNGTPFPIKVGDYRFPDELVWNYGYIYQIREYVADGKLYKYLDILVGKSVKTIKFNPDNPNDPVTQAISNLFGVFYKDDDLFDYLIRVQVKNTVNSLGQITFSRITNFQFIKPEAEEALINCAYFLFGN